MVRPPCVDSNGMKKGAWSEEEDNKLRAYVLRYGHWNWRLLPKYAGLSRCGKSCRLRWVNYLKPGVRRGDFTKEEEELIIKLHSQLGNKWSAIATKLPGRTDNEIKNYYHTRIEKHGKRKPSTNKKDKRSACEASSSKDVRKEALDTHKNRDESDNSEATSLGSLQDSTVSSLETSTHKTTQSQMEFWPEQFQADANSFPPLIEEEFFYPQRQYSELSSSDSSYMSPLDWIADDAHSIISCEYVDPTFHGSLWSESSASNYNQSVLLDCFDYGMDLFS